jgi:hypothetical protein
MLNCDVGGVSQALWKNEAGIRGQPGDNRNRSQQSGLATTR